MTVILRFCLVPGQLQVCHVLQQQIDYAFVLIGSKPIVWYISRIYAVHGYTGCIVCHGCKGYMIKEYFANSYLHNPDVMFDHACNDTTVRLEGSGQEFMEVLAGTQAGNDRGH